MDFNAEILLIDDHPSVRQGLSLILSQAGFTVCAEASNLTEAKELALSLKPRAVVLDISLGGQNGLDLLEELNKLEITALVYTMYENRTSVEQAFAKGALGYVTKSESPDVLVQALGEVLAGRAFVSPRAGQSLAGRLMRENQEQWLSQREKDILKLIGQGESNPDIASSLCISVRTVETYCSRIIDKLKLGGMRELRKHAISQAIKG